MMTLGTIATILSLLGTISAAGYAIWRKRWSPEAQLARMKAEAAASEAATKVEAERLEATYKRIEKEQPGDKDIFDRINRAVK
jgi:hypothetical protein